MRLTIAEEVKIVNDITVLGTTGDYRGLANADLLDESYSLKTVIWP